MEQTFQGKYYNGLSSKALEAVIALEDDAILIAYTDKDGEPQTVAWDIAQMHKNEFIAKDRVTLQYGSFPPQSLEVISQDFVRALKAKYAGKEFMKSHYHFLANKGWRGVIIGGTLCVTLVVLFYFFGVPAIAESVAEKFPIEYEEQLGQDLFLALVKEYRTDSIKTEQVSAFFKELKYPSKYNIKVTVVDFEMVNAFAVPGGNIVVFTGILDKMKSSNELAALLAHEASHVELRHSTKSIFRSLANYLFISLIFYDVNAIASILIDNANMLTNLHYSRGLEQEADENGLKMMLERGIDPQGMIQLFETLKEEGHRVKINIPKKATDEIGEDEENQGSAENVDIVEDTTDAAQDQEVVIDAEPSEPTEFMSSHPLLSNRINYIKGKIATQKYNIKENTELNALWEKIKSENQ